MSASLNLRRARAHAIARRRQAEASYAAAIANAMRNAVTLATGHVPTNAPELKH